MFNRLLILILAFLCADAYGQKMMYHRTYPVNGPGPNNPDTSYIVLDAVKLTSGTIAVMSGAMVKGDSTLEYLTIATIGGKGDPGWIQKIDFPNTKFSMSFASLLNASNDSLYFACTKIGSDNNKIIGQVLKSNGRGLKTSTYDSPDNETYSTFNANLIIEAKKDSTIKQIITQVLGNTTAVNLNAYSRDLQLVTSKKLNIATLANANLDLTVTDFEASNTGAIISGAVSKTPSILPIPFIGVLDANDNVKWAKSYRPNNASFTPFATITKTIKVGNDYVALGKYFDINLINITQSYFGSFIMRVDSIGRVKWTKQVDVAKKRNSTNGIVALPTGEVIVTGTTLQNNQMTPFMMQLKADGSQNWLKYYPRSTTDTDLGFASFTNSYSSLFPNTDGGYAYVYTDIDDPQNRLMKSAIIYSDKNGKVGCEIESSDALLSNAVFAADTLKNTVTAITPKTSDKMEKDEKWDNFDIAVLGLEFKTFCPNEPVDFTFKPEIKVAVKSYEWSDGSKADTLRVFELGQYHVTITIDTLYCFQLCDTVELDESALPTVFALKGPKVCVGAPFSIITSIDAQSGIKSIVWSTGEKDKSTIVTSTLGTYSVTITDKCMDTATSSLTVDESIYFGPPTASGALGPKVCINTPFTITAAGVGGGGGPYTFKWSTTETTSIITPNKVGPYIVTVTDKCGLTSSATINVDNSIWIEAPTVAVAKGGLVCKGKEFILNAAGAGGGGDYKYKWSTAQEGSFIQSATLGTYTVTVTDKCGLTASTSVTVGQEIYFGPPDAGITFDNGPICENAELILKAGASNGGGLPYTYLWSENQQKTETIKVKELKTYNVTVTDKCGLTGSAAVTLTNAIWFKAPSVAIDEDINSSYCNTGKIGLSALAQGGGGSYTYSWSTGATSASTQVDGSGTYKVTVTDKCAKTAEESFKVEINTDSLSNCIVFPNIFMPLNLLDTSSTGRIKFEDNLYFFGVNQCGAISTVGSYELNVFNRWGQLVYNTSDIMDKWDGRDQNGGQYPSDIYVWYVRYKVGQFCEVNKKGDINLFR